MSRIKAKSRGKRVNLMLYEKSVRSLDFLRAEMERKDTSIINDAIAIAEIIVRQRKAHLPCDLGLVEGDRIKHRFSLPTLLPLP